MHAAFVALDQFSEIYLWVLKIISEPLLSSKKNEFLHSGQEQILKLGKPVKDCG